MGSSIFSAGISPGSPATDNEVKILICYLLSQTKVPMSFAELHEALREHNLVNYFQLIQALSSMEESGHIVKLTVDDSHSFTVTELGEKTADTLDNSLPLSVRQKAIEAAKLVVARNNRLNELTAIIEPSDDGGYTINMAIPDFGNNLISCSVFAPTKSEADRIRTNFLNDPVFIYQSIMAILSGDTSILNISDRNTTKLF